MAFDFKHKEYVYIPPNDSFVWMYERNELQNTKVPYVGLSPTGRTVNLSEFVLSSSGGNKTREKLVSNALSSGRHADTLRISVRQVVPMRFRPQLAKSWIRKKERSLPLFRGILWSPICVRGWFFWHDDGVGFFQKGEQYQEGRVSQSGVIHSSNSLWYAGSSCKNSIYLLKLVFMSNDLINFRFIFKRS